MSAKHTPGPWSINPMAREYSGKLEITSPAGDNGTHVASVSVEKKGFTYEQAANARLIAAAPDLLVALEAFMDEANTRDVRAMARAAIAAARGAA